MQIGGWNFSVLAADIDESPLPDEEPFAYVRRTATAKARAVVDLLKTQTAFNSRGAFRKKDPVGKEDPVNGMSAIYVLAADTTVVDGKDILGKPRDEAEAVTMLTRLRSRIHQVYTALALARVENQREDERPALDEGSLTLRTSLCMTEVVMRHYQDDEITSYVASGDALDKAGSYAIQNGMFNPVKCIRGCYTNVMGLPLCHVAHIFQDVGVHPAKQEQEIFSGCRQITSEEFLDSDGCHEIWANQNGETSLLAPSMSFSVQ